MCKQHCLMHIFKKSLLPREFAKKRLLNGVESFQMKVTFCNKQNIMHINALLSSFKIIIFLIYAENSEKHFDYA